MKKKLTVKQKKFVDEYLTNGGNATAAAQSAGYSPTSAYSIGAENLRKPEIISEIKRRLEKLSNERTATITEIMEFATATMRGEVEEEVVLTIGNGRNAHSEKVITGVKVRDRIEAAKLLAKLQTAAAESKDKMTPTTIKIIRASKEKPYNS